MYIYIRIIGVQILLRLYQDVYVLTHICSAISIILFGWCNIATMYEATIIFSLFLISFRSHRSVSNNIHLHSVMYSPIPRDENWNQDMLHNSVQALVLNCYRSTPCRYENRICYITMHCCYMFSNHVHNYLMKWNFIINSCCYKEWSNQTSEQRKNCKYT